MRLNRYYGLMPSQIRDPAAWNPAAREGELVPLGPDSVTWKVFGDLAYVVGAGRRLLIDVCHPVVAAGVGEYSAFETDPWGRAERTMKLMLGVVYGQDEALAIAEAVRNRHKGMSGQHTDSTRWSAFDPDAFHWVHASIIDGIWMQQKHFGRQWQTGEVERFYLEMKQVGRLYGVRERDMPENWSDFRVWFDQAVQEKLVRSDITDRVIYALRHPKAPPVRILGFTGLWNIAIRPIAGRVNLFNTVGLLPASLRTELGLKWTPLHQFAFRINSLLTRTIIRALPARISMLPDAYKAVRS